MRILFLVNTPAHAHLHRHPVEQLRKRGHSVLVLAREHGCTTDLLEYFDLPYECYGTHDPSDGRLSMARSILSQFASIITRTRSYDPDVVIGRGQYAAIAGAVTGGRTILVLDDEPSGYNHTISRPFADLILSPSSTRRSLGRRHYTFEGFTETAYLHPAVFSPSGDVKETLGIDADEPFILCRFNAHEALHDRGLRGFSRTERTVLIEELAARAQVLVSDENGVVDIEELPATRFDAHPARIHDAIAAASLVVADTGTIVIEGALIGTPTLRYRGTDQHIYGEFETLVDAGLLEQFDRLSPLLTRATSILDDETVAEDWRTRRDAVVASHPNVTDLIVTIAEAQGRVPPAHPAIHPAAASR